jgi:hypothetical protein
MITDTQLRSLVRVGMKHHNWAMLELVHITYIDGELIQIRMMLDKTTKIVYIYPNGVISD